MKKIFTLIIICLAVILYQNNLQPVFASVQGDPTISITTTPVEKNSDKLIKVKTTIVTQKSEKTKSEPTLELKKEKRDIELSSDVDKILKEMDIDDTDPLTETPSSSVDKIYKPVKKNFIWVAFSIILFPVILFTLLIKAMQAAKTRFEKEEKEKGLSKEEKLLDELEKEQKKTKKKHRSLSEILGGSRQKTSESTAFEDDFDREDEDFEFMVEEVLLIEDEPEVKTDSEPEVIEQQQELEPEPEPVVKPKKEKSESSKKSKPEKQEEVPAEEPVVEAESNIIDSFEIDNDLKFLLIKKDDSCNLVCKLKDREIVIMNLDKAQKFNKVRKIDSKPGRDVYMVKLDSWRGLIEVKEDSVKYLMDI